MQKQPKNSTVKQMSEMVTDEEVKQNKDRSSELHQKISLCWHMECNDTL